MAKFGIIVVIGISLTFIQKVPKMINAIFGTQGGLTDAKSFVYQGLQIASTGARAVAGSLKSVGRSAFGRTLEAYKDAKSTINSTTANMRDSQDILVLERVWRRLNFPSLIELTSDKGHFRAIFENYF
ncbi:hypothetical protein HpMS33_03320 [Helicobacter pylori]